MFRAIREKLATAAKQVAQVVTRQEPVQAPLSSSSAPTSGQDLWDNPEALLALFRQQRRERAHARWYLTVGAGSKSQAYTLRTGRTRQWKQRRSQQKPLEVA